MIRQAAAATALAVSLCVTAPSTANAMDFTLTEPHTGDRPKTLELHAGFAYIGVGPAIGGRFGLPIVKNGFIGGWDNAVYLTVGLDLYATFPGGFGFGVGVPITGAWNFYFNDKFSAFADVGLNLYFNTYYLRGAFVFPIGNWITAGVGGRYHLNEKLALLARVGSPYAAVGIELAL